MILEEQFYDGTVAPLKMGNDQNIELVANKSEQPLFEYYDILKRNTLTGIQESEPIMMANPVQDTAVAVALTTKKMDEPKQETILGNNLTKSQKWAWVIGLSFAAWAVIYWSNKESK